MFVIALTMRYLLLTMAVWFERLMAAIHNHKVRLNIVVVVYVVSIDVCYIVGAVEESSIHIICQR